VAADIAAGRLDRAHEVITRIHRALPEAVHPVSVLGQIALLRGDLEAARRLLARAVERAPVYEYCLLHAVCLQRLGEREAGLAQLRQAVMCMPQVASAALTLGEVAEGFDQPELAAGLYEHGLALDAELPGAHHRLGLNLLHRGQVEAAVPLLLKAVARAHMDAAPYIDLSSALATLGRFVDAEATARAGCVVAPDDPKLLNNLGHALLNLNRSGEAVEVFARSLAIVPETAVTRFGHATALLKSGDFGNGWREYEWRWRDCQTMRDDIAAPLWQGEDLAGCSILLHMEQGFGDALQFIRFVERVAARGAFVAVHVPQALARLFRDVAGVGEVIVCYEPGRRFDYHCPLVSLPFRLGLPVEEIPAAPYLRVPVEEAARQGNALRRHVTGADVRPDLIVGLVWSGEPRPGQQRAHFVDRRRSMMLANFAPLFGVPGVRFVSFQLGEARGQIGEAGLPVVDGMGGVEDFADTAARLSGVDLLISVDTSVVHLAGGLGVPVWMLTRFDRCWRWFDSGEWTPWYPSMRVLQQDALGDWASAVGKAEALLRAFVAAYRQELALSA